MSFSERHGLKPVREIIQLDSIDEPLKNGLWSLLKIHVWDGVRYSSGVYGGHYLSNNKEHKALCDRLWLNYFKKPLDRLDDDWGVVLPELRSYFFKCSWNEVYDFIEFVANNYRKYQFQEAFTNHCNAILEKEMSAYRFVDRLITQITNQQEVEEIEDALETSTGAVNSHLRRSLELLSNREKPDYRNSIKESISAVESYVAIVVGEEKGTLGSLLKKLEDEVGLHPALKTAFSNLYGYTSDKGGIRHAMIEIENTDFSDAKFMLVVCSAFINFVEGKANLQRKS